MSRGGMLQVDMGRVSFMKDDIPMRVTANEVVEQKITVAGRTFTFTGATIGNPHCAIVLPEISEKMARIYGPLLENHPYFPLKTNVEFIRIIDRNNIQLELWERGSGYTLSSGSLSSAASAVTRRLGLCDADITAHMPGGTFRIRVSDDYDVRLTGPVTKVSEGTISSDIFKIIPRNSTTRDRVKST
jgi:diaminopimelate epimerase